MTHVVVGLSNQIPLIMLSEQRQLPERIAAYLSSGLGARNGAADAAIQDK